MKKRIITISLCFAICTGSFEIRAQEQINSDLLTKEYLQVKEVFGEEWMLLNPDAVLEYEKCLRERVRLEQIPLTNEDKYPLLSHYPVFNNFNENIQGVDLENFDPSEFTPLHYDLPFLSDQTTIIRIDNLDYVLIIEGRR